jgi:hypothetical protein
VTQMVEHTCLASMSPWVQTPFSAEREWEREHAQIKHGEKIKWNTPRELGRVPVLSL